MALINCPECGREISSEAKACPHCGYEIKDTYVEEVRCSCCGTKNHPKAEYCIGCDTRLVPYKRENAIENPSNAQNGNRKGVAKELFTILAVILVIFFIMDAPDKETQTTSSQSNKEIREVTPLSAESIQESIPDFEDFEDFGEVGDNFKYKDIIRHPEKFIDEKVIITVEVKQVMEGGLFDDGIYYRVYTDNDSSGYYYDDEYFVYDCRKDGDKILEGDVIKVYGAIIGIEELKRAITRTTDDIPSLKMYYYELISE